MKASFRRSLNITVLAIIVVLFFVACEDVQERQIILAPESVDASDGEFSDAIQIRWNKVAGASTYIIYRQDVAGDDYKRIGETAENLFRDTYVNEPGVDYYYKIRTSGQGNFSSYSNPDRGFVKVQYPLNLSATKGEYAGKIILNWGVPSGYKQKSGVYFELYKSKKAGGAFLDDPILINDPSQIIFTDTIAASETGTIFYYTMRSFAGSHYSEYSQVDSGWSKITSPSRVVASKADFTDEISVQWSELKNITGIKIYRKVEGGTLWEGYKELGC